MKKRRLRHCKWQRTIADRAIVRDITGDGVRDEDCSVIKKRENPVFGRNNGDARLHACDLCYRAGWLRGMRADSLRATVGLSRVCRDREGPSRERHGAVAAARVIIA